MVPPANTAVMSLIACRRGIPLASILDVSSNRSLIFMLMSSFLQSILVKHPLLVLNHVTPDMIMSRVMRIGSVKPQ